ncbi:NUDIX domain-containing protein [Rhizobium terrae]|uniref:NUDIX domain-containing protein n=1 Tax=Rhizobium terrae TaxID=2171756 RepID=UPI000E3D49E5|nr:NUDIX domain-containing protein [Rhizobium terrae]
MPKRSAGLLIFRYADGEPEVLLVHPGGPFWKNKDEAAWSIPKGLVEKGEDELSAAIRETAEEIGNTLDGPFEWLGEYRQPGGKQVLVWTVEANPAVDQGHVASNMFSLEWPPHSGRFQEFPEVDRAEWFRFDKADRKILKGQAPILADFAKRSGNGGRRNER